MKKRWNDLDPELRHNLAEGRRKKRGKPSAQELRLAVVQAEVDAFNKQHIIGTPVRYWTGARGGPGEEGYTRTAAWVAGGHTSVVMVTGHPAWIALSHVDAIDSARASA